MNEENNKDWKLKLRYGKLTTPYTHYTMLADCRIGKLKEGYDCPPGNAVVGLSIWASDTDEAVLILRSLGEQIGFLVQGKVEIYKTDPRVPPKDVPYAYGINFHSYS